MSFRKIHLLDQVDFLACTVATTVLNPDIRVLAEIGKRVIENGYDWAIANRGSDKNEQWWRIVKDIEEQYSWDKLKIGDSITAKVNQGSLEFGSIKGVGGGCHRCIALAMGLLFKKIIYKPFDILLYCP